MLIIKPCPLAARMCCTFSPTTFSSVQFTTAGDVSAALRSTHLLPTPPTHPHQPRGARTVAVALQAEAPRSLLCAHMDPATSRRRRAKRNATTTLLVAAAFAAATSHGAVTVPDLPVEVDLRTLGFKRRRISNRDYWGSTWGVMVKKGTYRDATTPQGNKFQRRFRATPEEYENLVSEVREKGWWQPNATDAAGRPAAPVELLMLGVLRMLGRACTFDDLGQCCRLCCRLCCHAVCWYDPNPTPSPNSPGLQQYAGTTPTLPPALTLPGYSILVRPQPYPQP